MIRIDFTDRTVSRAQWKTIWRQLRIVKREAAQAESDMMFFGTGYLETGPEVPDFIRCVHPSNVAIDMMAADAARSTESAKSAE